MKTNDGNPRLTARQDVLGLAAFLLVCLVVSGIGGLVTATSVGGWYATLNKPVFNPPNWVFGPVWTVLYLAMAVAAWRVWRRAESIGRIRALAVFGIQLGLNLLWSVLFFGFQQIGLTLVDIVLLLTAITLNARLFWHIDRVAGWFFVPYIVWVVYATALNGSLWLLN